MNRQKITAVIPIREGSQRVPGKNFKPFYKKQNLLQLKIEVLKKVKFIDSIVVNTDSDQAIEIARRAGVDYFRRQKYYASSTCTNSEHWHNLAETTNSDLIMHTPCTAPMIRVETYNDIISRFSLSNNDSATTVGLVKDYLWLNGSTLNYDKNKVQNSQDLPDVYKLTFGASIIPRDLMLEKQSIIGDDPLFYTLHEYEEVDIDTPLDFEFAQFIYKKNV